MIVDFSWFKNLGHLARTGNFSQAAEIGNISQPAFSRRIKALEAWVGVPLVDRSSHPVALTSAGVQMLEAGQQALERLETERTHVREAQALPENCVVTFGAQHSIGWRFYPAWLQAFEEAYGPVISRLRADDLPNCLKDLKDGELDFVIAYGSALAEGSMREVDVESLLIGQDTLIPVCKPASSGGPLFAVASKTPLEVPYLRFGDSAPISQHIEPLLQRERLSGKLRTVYENSMAGALRIRAREGIGVAWLPRTLVAQDLQAGLLIQTGDPAWEIELQIRLHRTRGTANELTSKIWTFLKAREAAPLGVRL